MFVLGLRLRDIGVRVSNVRFCAGIWKTVRPSAVDVAGLVEDCSSRCFRYGGKDAVEGILLCAYAPVIKLR
jgi:hypothetical protein